MDARTIEHIAATDSSAETTELLQRWRDIVKQGYLSPNWGKVEEIPRTKIPAKRTEGNRRKITTNKRGREQGDLRQRIGPQHNGGFQPQTRRSEQWTVDPF